MRIQKCYFCSGPVYPGHGMMFVRNDCKTFRFCRPKCHKHFKAKHNPRKLAWTKAYRKIHNKQIAKDSIFELQKKRDEPAIYNRNTYINTIQAMKKVAEVRERRENRFWENRMILASKQKHKDVMVELEKNPSLISDKETRNQVVENKNLRIKEEEQRKVQKGKLEVVEME